MGNEVDEYDGGKESTMKKSTNPSPTTSPGIISMITSSWGGKSAFLLSQMQVIAVLIIARVGDRWEPSYPRNQNHNMILFYGMHAVLLLATICTWKHTPPRDPNSNKVTFLSRGQTEEWKGWMQFTFIMYHYYRAWSSYNWIRIFVSSYVWMTGFGNFLYFDKKKDFSLDRIVSMCIRINYFPILLSLATGVSLDLYYVVPLHTEGFFMTMITCRMAILLEDRYKFQYWSSRSIAIAISLAAHVLFFETQAVDSLLYVSTELHFRFQADKYSALVGIMCGALMHSISKYMAWAYGNTDGHHKPVARWGQRIMGFLLIASWYSIYGIISVKETYNLYHPYIFSIPMIGWLMIRNSSRYLTECHSTFLEFLGRNTLETYVLQFHLFMNHSVQHIPIIIPGSGSDGGMIAKSVNMLLCGTVFVAVAIWARKVTVTTQTTIVDLMKTLRARKGHNVAKVEYEEERKVLAKV